MLTYIFLSNNMLAKDDNSCPVYVRRCFEEFTSESNSVCSFLMAVMAIVRFVHTVSPASHKYNIIVRRAEIEEAPDDGNWGPLALRKFPQ